MTHFGNIINNARTTARDIWFAEMDRVNTNFGATDRASLIMQLGTYRHLVIKPRNSGDGFLTGPNYSLPLDFIEGYCNGDMKHD